MGLGACQRRPASWARRCASPYAVLAACRDSTPTSRAALTDASGRCVGAVVSTIVPAQQRGRPIESNPDESVDGRRSLLTCEQPNDPTAAWPERRESRIFAQRERVRRQR